MRSPLKVRLSLHGGKQPDNDKGELDQLAEEDDPSVGTEKSVAA
jgi:hypothetical protein